MSEQQQAFEGWGTSSGLLDDENITINSAEFRFDANYNTGQTLVLAFDVTTDEGEEEVVLLPMGDDWEPVGGGATCERTGGKKAKVSANSAYGEWMRAAIGVAGAEIANRGTSLEAAVWAGTKWHVEREERKFKMRNGEERTTSRLLPTEFLGVDGDKGGKGAAKGAKAAPKAAAKAEASGGGDDGLSGALKVALIKCAKASADYMTFMDAGFAIDGVNGNPAAEACVLDEAFYNQHH